MPALINWELVRQPYNWAVVVLMCLFALILLSLIWPEDADQGDGGAVTRTDVTGAPALVAS